MRTTLALALLVAGCGADDHGSGIPESIREVAGHQEVEAFSGWSLPGVTLYRTSFAVADRSSATIVGLDDATGEVLRGAALMRRIGDAPPELLAARVFDVLLGQQGAHAETAESRGSLGTDAEWAAVRPARVEEGTLVFFGWQGEMAPELVEHRVSTTTWEVRTRPVTELLDPADVVTLAGPARCLPVSACGCWTGCALLEPIRVGDHPDEERFQDGEVRYVRSHDCATRSGVETCARICASDAPDATCEDAVQPEEEECTEACPPTEAFFHCEREGRGCRRVDHPARRAAAAR
ncbi:MAG: hypothetical protein R3B82_29630 [Sandaracinaceae bacterium]